jgi:hypothetical protein
VAARDPGWDLLLDYDGETFVLAGGYWVKFEVRPGSTLSVTAPWYRL